MASRLIDLISKKTNCTCSKLFLITKNKFARATRFFVFPLPLFCTTTTLFCTTKTSNIIFMEKLSYVLTQYFISRLHVRFSFSPCWPLAFLIFSPPLWISMFFFLRNSSPLFSITRGRSFSVIHISVNIKNNAEKDTTLLLFFLSKSLGGDVISFQITPRVAFRLLYLLIELVCLWCGRTVGWAAVRSV